MTKRFATTTKLDFLCINVSPPFLGQNRKAALIWKSHEVRNRMFDYDFSRIGNPELARIAKNCPRFCPTLFNVWG
jgi:hypothetical protein